MTFHLPVYSARASFSEIEPAQWAMVSINRKKLIDVLGDLFTKSLFMASTNYNLFMC